MQHVRRRFRAFTCFSWVSPLCCWRAGSVRALACAAAPHAPVLVAPLLEHFEGRRMRVFVDGTVGAGGHANALLESCTIDRYIGIDKDATALALARERLAGRTAVELLNADFRDLPAVLRDVNVAPGDIGGMLLDVGVSSMQLDTPERGFSFMRDGPLDMRMASGPQITGPSAADLVNGLGEDELCRIFRLYGEEPRARIMADRIVQSRTTDGAITTTLRLADILSCGRRKTARGVHPATLCFQALRIAVNGELDALTAVLPEAVKLLEPHTGRLAVISFHSLEDRIVKQSFRNLALLQGGVRILTKRPIVASDDECRGNARSRSAKLRIVERLGHNELPRVGKVNKYRREALSSDACHEDRS